MHFIKIVHSNFKNSKLTQLVSNTLTCESRLVSAFLRYVVLRQQNNSDIVG